jgi:hypothetical protein
MNEQKTSSDDFAPHAAKTPATPPAGCDEAEIGADTKQKLPLLRRLPEFTPKTQDVLYLILLVIGLLIVFFVIVLFNDVINYPTRPPG